MQLSFSYGESIFSVHTTFPEERLIRALPFHSFWFFLPQNLNEPGGIKFLLF
jgi:hypothetical protein